MLDIQKVFKRLGGAGEKAVGLAAYYFAAKAEITPEGFVQPCEFYDRQGHLVLRQQWENGQVVRTEQHFPDQTMIVRHWRNGKLHRDPDEGPAELRCTLKEEFFYRGSDRFYVDGIEVPKPARFRSPKPQFPEPGSIEAYYNR